MAACCGERRGAAGARAATRPADSDDDPPGDQLYFDTSSINRTSATTAADARSSNHTQHKAMLRRDPTRIEMKPEDIEEFDAYVAQQKATKKEDKGEKPTKKDERDARIGYRPTMSDSPGY